MSYSYSVHLCLISSNLILNLCGPDREGIPERTNKIIAYRNNKDRFYSKLEQSILFEGIKNPIVVTSGHCPKGVIKFLPEEYKSEKDYSDLLICDRHGGSRLFVAQKYKIPVPCIVNDFNGRFSSLPELSTLKEIKSKFVHKPKKVLHSADGIHIYELPQYQQT